MSRYIDADKLTFSRVRIIHPDGTIGGWNAVVMSSVINNTPTADVVEVVRCEKCKHLEIINSREVYAKCRMTDLEFKPFDIDTRKHYCSYGERREENEG